MKFSTREDIDAPVETVYQAVTDFDGFERQILRRGIDLTRDETRPPDVIGARWNANFKWRGRPQDLEAELVSIEPNEGYAIESRTGGIVCMGVVDLVSLSKARTRMFVSLDLKPTTLSAKLLVQSLRLAKGSLSRRFKMRVADFASDIGD